MASRISSRESKCKSRTGKTTKSIDAASKPTPTASMTTATTLIKSERKTLTSFQAKVYLALCLVPEGKVTTYKYLSNAVGCGSSQAVGQALKNNPYAPTVPCHRVVQSDLSIGGFGGARRGEKIDKKIQLLESEGVIFRENGSVDPCCLYKFA